MAQFENSYEEAGIKNWRMLWGISFLDGLDRFEQARRLSERCGGTAADNLSIEPGTQLAEDTHGHGRLAITHPAIPNSRFKGALPV